MAPSLESSVEQRMESQRPMDPILLIGSIIVLAAFLTWLLPAGQFARIRDSQTGLTRVIPGSYKLMPRHVIGPWETLMSIPEGLIEAAEVVFFVLLSGAAITVVEATGAIANFLHHVMRRFAHRPLLVLAIASALFLAGGASDNMYEEILAFIPLLCLLMRRLNLDPVMALGVSVGTASVAAVFSPFNTFLLGVSQPLAEVPLFSGFAFRAAFFILALAIWGGYLAWYTRRFPSPLKHAGPERPVMSAAPSGKWKPRDIAVLVVFNAGMIAIVAGGIFLRWGLRHFSAVFVAMALVAGLVGGLGWRSTAEQFAEEIRGMAVAAALVGFARAISVILAHGLILDTIANALSVLSRRAFRRSPCALRNRYSLFPCRAIRAGR